MKVHRSVKTRLEAGKIFAGEAYVPQVRPHFGSLSGSGRERKREAQRLDYRQWNVDNPKYWEWVD